MVKANVKIKLTEDTAINGEHFAKGSTAEVTPQDARYLVGNLNKARYASDEDRKRASGGGEQGEPGVRTNARTNETEIVEENALEHVTVKETLPADQYAKQQRENAKDEAPAAPEKPVRKVNPSKK